MNSLDRNAIGPFVRLESEKAIGLPFRCSLFMCRLGFIDRLEEAGKWNGFEQVIDRIQLKSLDCKLCIGRCEDHFWRIAKGPQEGKTIEARHLNIQKEQIDLLVLEALHGREGIGAFAQHIQERDALRMVKQNASSLRLIVDDQTAHLSKFSSIRTANCSSLSSASS